MDLARSDTAGRNCRRERCAVLLAVLGTLQLSSIACAAEALIVEAREVRRGDIVAHNVSLRLTPRPADQLDVQLRAGSVDLGETLGTLAPFALDCSKPQLRSPAFACNSSLLTGHSSLLGPFSMHARLQWNSDTGVLRFDSTDQAFAGGKLTIAARSDARGWTVSGNSAASTLTGLRAQVARWLSLPASIETSGAALLQFEAAGVESADTASALLQLKNVDFGNEDATIAGEKLAATLRLELRRAGDGYDMQSQVTSAGGQALLGMVLLDLNVNPLEASASGRWQGEQIDIQDLQVRQQNLLLAHGTALLRPAGAPYVRRANLTIDELLFPAAYSSFLQIALAAGDFGTLKTTGRIQGQAQILDDAIARVDATLQDLQLRDQKNKFSVARLQGLLHWLPESGAAPAPSTLEWEAGSAYGLSGGRTKLEFTAQGLGFQLTKPARVPVFDGALRIDSLFARDLTTPKVTMRFTGEIEPISMPLLSKAFGWPELAGQLAGKIPRVDYTNKELVFTGDVEAQVFNGSVVGSNLRLKDPLGPWPRLFADVHARNLDLALVTNAFSIGSITGRLEGEILGLELFNWSPVAFDAALRTPPGDRGRHRISAKAVGNLSNIGGGGGGVAKALQSGAFKMFDEYDYARLGLRCKLANEVCLMSGVEPAGIGYYILQGKGLPHIDIIGNAGRVNWPQLLSQISAQMRGEGGLRVE